MAESAKCEQPTRRDALRQRIDRLRREEIEYVGQAEYQPAGAGVDSNAELIAAATCQRATPPSDLPAHLARLCEVELLSVEQEQAMFRSMNYLKYRAWELVHRLDRAAPDEQLIAEAEHLLEAAREIRDQLVQANMRLAISVVKKFVTPQRSFDDMLSDGIFSLMRAVEKFDYGRGFRFSTYAYRAIARNAYRKIQDTQKEAVRLVSAEGEEFEVADQGPSGSLDERTWELLRGALAHLFQRLDRREQFILRARYALGAHRKVKTFQSLADKLGLSKERVRQLEQRAVAKLRRWSTEMQVFG